MIDIERIWQGEIPQLMIRTAEFYAWFEGLQSASRGNALAGALWEDAFISGMRPEEAWDNGKTLLTVLDGHNMSQVNTIFPVWYTVALALAGETSETLIPLSAWRGYQSQMTPPMFLLSLTHSAEIKYSS